MDIGKRLLLLGFRKKFITAWILQMNITVEIGKLLLPCGHNTGA
jgi:hypothetical protein